MASLPSHIQLQFLDRPVRITTQTWPDGTRPLVSILCITYNHVEYLIECLNGCLMQETTFPVEIIVHDDASIDGTRNIIEKYTKEYPGIIKACLQEKNQYSLRKKPSILAFAHARGEFIALCDGDDFWIDHEKLEFQIQEMRALPECDLSFHPVIAEYCDSMQDEEIICRHDKDRVTFAAHDVIIGDGGFCPTPSLVIRRTIFENLPNWFSDAPVGDYYLQILGSLRGGALYLNKVMAVYRVRTPNSWARRMTETRKRTEFHIRTIYTLFAFNEWLDYSYNTAFTDRILNHGHLLLEALELTPSQPTRCTEGEPASPFEPLGTKHKISAYFRRMRRFGIKRTLSHSISNIFFTWMQYFRAIADRPLDN